MFGPFITNGETVQGSWAPPGAGGGEVPSDPRLGPLVANLLRVSAAEIAHQRKQASNSWFGGSSNRTQDAARWADYAQSIEREARQGPMDLARVRSLIAEAPARGGTVLLPLASLLRETDAELFYQDIFSLARELDGQGRHPGFTQGLLEIAALHPSTVQRAENLLELRRGGGSLGARFARQAGPLVEELTSPMFLIPFGAASYSARLASLSVLSRSSHWGWRTWLASEGAALAAEVPTLVLSRRLGMQAFVGGENLFDPRLVSHEMLATLGPFAMLRGAGNAFRFASPHLSRVQAFRNTAGELNALGRGTMATVGFGTEVSAVMGGHLLNGALGIEPLPQTTDQLLFSSILTVAHMRVASRFIERLSPGGITEALQGQRRRLQDQTVENLYQEIGLTRDSPLRGRLRNELGEAMGDARLGPLTMESWMRQARAGRMNQVSHAMGLKGLPLHAALFANRSGESFSPSEMGSGGMEAFAFAGGYGSRGIPFGRSGKKAGLAMMTHDGSENGPSSGPRNRGSEPAPPSSESDRRKLRELGRRIEEVREKTGGDKSGEKLTGAAERLSDLWNRFTKDPKKAPKEGLQEELQELREDIDEATASGRGIQDRIRELGLWVSRLRSERKSKQETPSQPELPVDIPPVVPKEPQGIFRERVADPLARVGVRLRDWAKERVGLGEPTRRDSPPPAPKETRDQESELESVLDSVSADLQKRNRLGQVFQDSARTLATLRRHLYQVAQGGEITQRWQARMNELVAELKKTWPNISWNLIGRTSPDFSSSEIASRRQGSLMALALEPNLLTSDSPLASRLRQLEVPGVLPQDRQIELLHQGILMASHFEGSPRKLSRSLESLAQEYDASPENSEAMRHLGEGLFEMYHGRQTLDSLYSRLIESSKGGPLVRDIESLRPFLEGNDVDIGNALNFLGARPEAKNYFLTGLFLALRSGGGTEPMSRLMQTATGGQHPGFHPSIAASLFGAEKGSANFPQGWLPREFNADAFLVRAKAEYQP